MMTTEAGAPFPRLTLEPVVSADEMCANARSALARGLPHARRCKPHGHALCVAGGGPSLSRTAPELGGYVAAVNGSLDYLLRRGIVPHACGVLDPGPHMADVVAADRRVRYFVASIVHPTVFDKLTAAGCNVTLWHPSGTPGLEDVVRKACPDSWLMVGGGCTMGLRWITLGYVLGFRRFDLHGLDSSFDGAATHAYPDRADGKDRICYMGRETRLNFVAQVSDFLAVMHNMARSDMDPTTIEVYGDGLLQDVWRAHADTREGSLEARERAKYRRMWSVDGYRHGSPGERQVDEIADALGPDHRGVLVDFGIGTGRCAAALAARGYTVRGVDIAANCLDADVDVPVVIAPLWAMPADLTADHGVCCDVMEHIPPEMVDASLAEMTRVVRGRTYFSISLRHDDCGQWIGAPLHLTVRDHAWWAERLAAHWPAVSVLGPGRFVTDNTRGDR